jgi:hypothetical protein
LIEECELAFKTIEMDITSNAFLSGVITEGGIWQQDQLHQLVSGLRICEAPREEGI